MLKNSWNIFCAMSFFLLTGCASGFSTYYNGMQRGEIDSMRRLSTCENPELKNYQIGEEMAVLKKLFENGYHAVGSSSFNGADNEGEQQALAYGKKLGACLVFFAKNHTGTRTGAMPITTPTTNSTYSSGTASYGGGYGTYSGTSTSYGTSTIYVPYSVERYDYSAIYAVKMAYGVLGLWLEDAPETYKRQFDTNSGAIVFAVGKGTPAYKANIFSGDILVSVNGDPIHPDVVSKNIKNGEINDIIIVRDGKTMKKEVFIE